MKNNFSTSFQHVNSKRITYIPITCNSRTINMLEICSKIIFHNNCTYKKINKKDIYQMA